LKLEKESKSLFGTFIQKTVRGQPQGGVRYWNYDFFEDFLRDGLRLSTGMGRKSALAGLWWGGGKGIIAAPQKQNTKELKTKIFQEYGKFVTGLRGAYIAAEDVGTVTSDIDTIFQTTRFVTCISPALGGSGNPSISTALGVVCGMEAGLDFLGMGTLKGKKIAMQGAGNVASYMMERLLERGVDKIVATEINQARINEIMARFKNDKRLEIRLVNRGDNSIMGEPCDILAPNALGGTLNSETIPKIKAKIVCGAANNQLLDPVADGKALTERNIIYIPDYVCNRMGIVNCANEQYGYVTGDEAIQRHFTRTWENSVFVITKKILEKAKKENLTTGVAANLLADEYQKILHPIWGHRTKSIINSLVNDGWHLDKF